MQDLFKDCVVLTRIIAMPLNQSLRKNSNVLWTLSLIQDQNPTAQTKDEFSEMAQDVIQTETIGSLTLCLADNLQRFRLMLQHGISEEEAIKECQKLKDTWEIDNFSTLQKLKEERGFSVLKWDEFLAWPELNNTIADLEKWYKENRDFRNDVDGRIRQARNNLPPDSKISNPLEQTVLLKKYLFEECAYQKFAASKGFHYEIYKNPMSKAMRRVKNNSDFVPGGVMVEVYFTQFNPTAKKKRENEDKISKNEKVIIDAEKSSPESFSHVFKRTKPEPVPVRTVSLPKAKEEGRKSPPQRIGEFIEKAFELLPEHQQEKAMEALIKFASAEILPLCYLDNTRNLKI